MLGVIWVVEKVKRYFCKMDIKFLKIFWNMKYIGINRFVIKLIYFDVK